jgi:hypothetical protein
MWISHAQTFIRKKRLDYVDFTYYLSLCVGRSGNNQNPKSHTVSDNKPNWADKANLTASGGVSVMDW